MSEEIEDGSCRDTVSEEIDKDSQEEDGRRRLK